MDLKKRLFFHDSVIQSWPSIGSTMIRFSMENHKVLQDFQVSYYLLD